MATVQLSDVYVPVPFNHAVDQAAIELNLFAASGVMTNDPIIQAAAAVGGWVGEIPHYNPLSTSAEPNYDSDNSGSNSTPKNIGSGEQVFRKYKINDSWSTMDLTRALALEDPLDAIARQVAKFWATQEERRLIKTLVGVYNSNVANDGGDMVFDISNDVAGAPAAGELISRDAFIDTKQTMGDHAENLAIVAMHSVVFARLQKNDTVEDQRDSEGELMFQTYQGHRILVDDSMPVISGVNRLSYITIFFGAGAVDSGAAPATIPSELERKPDSGDGGGQDIIYARRGGIIHPRGFSHAAVVPASGKSFIWSELEAAGTWTRVFDRKNVPVAFLRTNG